MMYNKIDEKLANNLIESVLIKMSKSNLEEFIERGDLHRCYHSNYFLMRRLSEEHFNNDILRCRINMSKAFSRFQSAGQAERCEEICTRIRKLNKRLKSGTSVANINTNEIKRDIRELKSELKDCCGFKEIRRAHTCVHNKSKKQ